MKLNPMEKKRLLTKRAKKALEGAGYGLVKKQGGGFLVINGETEEVLAEFEDIETLGETFSLWGSDVPEQTQEEIIDDVVKTGHWKQPPDRDPVTKLDTPTTAALRELNT